MAAKKGVNPFAKTGKTNMKKPPMKGKGKDKSGKAPPFGNKDAKPMPGGPIDTKTLGSMKDSLK